MGDESVQDQTPDESVLPDEPMAWGEMDSALGHFLQRWAPGAFGERATIRGVFCYRVLEEEFVEHPAPSEHNPGGLPERTILRAEVVSVEIPA